MESKVGNIFNKDKSLYEYWTSQEMSEYRKWNDFEKCSKCELLRFCRGCHAVSYGYTHDMYSAGSLQTVRSSGWKERFEKHLPLGCNFLLFPPCRKTVPY